MIGHVILSPKYSGFEMDALIFGLPRWILRYALILRLLTVTDCYPWHFEPYRGAFEILLQVHHETWNPLLVLHAGWSSSG